MSLKSTTIERYKKWCETHGASDKFTWEGKGWTKAEFDAEHFGGTSHKGKKEESYGDMGSSLDEGHAEEHGDGDSEGS